MRPLAAALVLLLAPTVQAQSDASDPWPAIRAERIATLLPDAMDRAGVEAWLILCRENDNDPMARHVGCENAGGEMAVVFFRTVEGVRSVAVSPSGEATALAEIGLRVQRVPLRQGDCVIWHHLTLRERSNGRVRL